MHGVAAGGWAIQEGAVDTESLRRYFVGKYGKPKETYITGHSMGGFCVLKFSEILQAENIPVSLAVTIDPPQVSPPVPLNIERYLNIFLSKSILGGSHIKPAQGYQSHFASFDLSENGVLAHGKAVYLNGPRPRVKCRCRSGPRRSAVGGLSEETFFLFGERALVVVGPRLAAVLGDAVPD